MEVPEESALNIFESAIPIKFEGADLLKEYGLTILNDDTHLSIEECTFLVRLIETNPYYGLQAHATIGTIYEKLKRRAQHWHGRKYIYINKYWTMYYDNDGEVSVQNHINNYEFKMKPVILNNIVDHRKTKQEVIRRIKHITTHGQPI